MKLISIVGLHFIGGFDVIPVNDALESCDGLMEAREGQVRWPRLH